MLNVAYSKPSRRLYGNHFSNNEHYTCKSMLTALLYVGILENLH